MNSTYYIVNDKLEYLQTTSNWLTFPKWGASGLKFTFSGAVITIEELKKIGIKCHIVKDEPITFENCITYLKCFNIKELRLNFQTVYDESLGDWTVEFWSPNYYDRLIECELYLKLGEFSLVIQEEIREKVSDFLLEFNYGTVRVDIKNNEAYLADYNPCNKFPTKERIRLF